MPLAWWLTLLLASSVEVSCGGRVTQVTREERLLRRQRRYLSFPTGSNLVLTLSLVKPLLQVQPQGYNLLGECDIPFPLPNDTRIIFNQHDKIRKRQRREVYVVFEDALTKAGLSGGACLKGLICDATGYVLTADKGRKSLVRDVLSAVFTIPEDQGGRDGFCRDSGLLDCELPLFRYVIASLSG